MCVCVCVSVCFGGKLKTHLLEDVLVGVVLCWLGDNELVAEQKGRALVLALLRRLVNVIDLVKIRKI